MHSTVVKVSPKQMSKLRNGHKVRVKPPEIEGEGCYIIVDPQNYDILNRTFSRNKGVELSLSPEEIQANKYSYSSPEQHNELLKKHKVGSGIFGKKFDRAVKKVVGKKTAKNIYDTARDFLPAAQVGLTGGLSSVGAALGTIQPELIPLIAPSVAGLSSLGNDYLANPSKYQGGKSSSLAKEYAKNLALQQLNQQLGTNMGNLSNASIQSALANKASAELTKAGILQRDSQPVLTDMDLQAMEGNGLRRYKKNMGLVGINSKLIDNVHPALQSQPYSANFQFQFTLPPAYQKFSKSGSGLYI